MRVLLAGNYQFPWYEQACANALECLGNDVIRFSWKNFYASFPGKIEEYLALDGPATWSANRALERTVAAIQPDMVVVWRGNHIGAPCLNNIRKQSPQCLIASYNNDDPFGPRYSSNAAPINHRRLWNRFKEAIPAYDLNFVYRPTNVAEYLDAGARNVHVLMPYFVPELHSPMKLTADELLTYGCDVVFVGHHEADGRSKYLRAIVRAGLKLRIFGNGWPQDVLASISPSLPPARAVLGEEYAKALCGAKVCLSFLSKLNRDTYTRRTFEIPACGGVMLSERTPDLSELFVEDKEAVYFDGEAELVEMATALVKDPARQASIGDAALRRVWSSGHDVVSRMQQMLTASMTARITSSENDI